MKINQVVRTASAQMVALQRTLHDAGLHSTAALVNDASKRLGWEAANIMEKKSRRTSTTTRKP